MDRKQVYEKMYEVTRLIPLGRVATYGQVAFLAGFPRGARLAGRAMSDDPGGTDVPFHRVVNSQGSCAPGFTEQRPMLESEGVVFTPSGKVDMKRHLWRPLETNPVP